ncbi:MAG TPA: hypothetical protein VLD67_01310 [Vicinamibacterales bacterium]|nr:hypothetical protein [Vicinamibacterales bacterium]
MKIQNFPGNETAALIEQLLTRRSKALSRQLRAVHDALDAAGRALQQPPPLDQQDHDLARGLNNAFTTAAAQFTEDARRAVDEARRELDSERAAKLKLAASLSSAEAELELRAAELRAAQERIGQGERELTEARETLEETDRRREAAEAAARREADARASLEEAATRNMGIQDALELELEDVRRALDESLSEIAALAVQLEEMAGEKGRLGIDLSAAQGELQMLRAQHEAVVAQLKASTARVQMLGKGREETIGQSQTGGAEGTRGGLPAHPQIGNADGLVSVVEASARSVEELARATTVADLLGGLARELSTEFCRVALFRVEGNRLQGTHQVGFDHTTDVRKIAVPLGVDSMLTHAVRTREIQRLRSGDVADEARTAPFRGNPSLALALPIVLHGETVAVAYLDDWDQSGAGPGRGSHDSSVLFARLVIRHAGVLFIGFAQELRALEELRVYASALVRGAMEMYDADAEAGMNPEVIRDRLEDNVACARQLFAKRAAHEGPAAAGLLDEQLQATIDVDPGAPFARDLGAILGRGSTPQSAQAS